VKHEKINKCNYKLPFSNILFGKVHRDVCLADETRFPACGDLVNWQFG
jgi:hypothetical protein